MNVELNSQKEKKNQGKIGQTNELNDFSVRKETNNENFKMTSPSVKP